MDALAFQYVMVGAVSIALTVATVGFHHEALRAISSMHPQHWKGRVNTGALIVFIILAHCVEAVVFSAGYWFSNEILGLGKFAGIDHMTPFVYLYFSLETFTTQSLGNIYPLGPLRLIAAIEPLVGLILIGWSTAFTFITLQHNLRAPPVDAGG